MAAIKVPIKNVVLTPYFLSLLMLFYCIAMSFACSASTKDANPTQTLRSPMVGLESMYLLE